MTELCDIALKYRTDKCPAIRHSYTPFYDKLFSARRSTINKVLELGIGDERFRTKIGDNAQLGASLKMWRDYFPNAQVYGVDIDPSSQFTDERIQTFRADATSVEDLTGLIKEIGDNIDLVVDDASHQTADQILTCRLLMPMLRGGVTYVIEDARDPKRVMDGLKDYDCTLAELAPIKGNHRHWNNIITVYHKW